MKKKRELLEKDIESHLRKRAMQAGFQPYKFVSPNRRSVPDQEILGSLEKVEAVLEGYGVPTDVVLKAMAECITFVECKRPNGKPTESQLREHAKLRARGFRVLLIDSKEQSDGLYNREI